MRARLPIAQMWEDEHSPPTFLAARAWVLVARRFKQRSELGAFLDPMADKLLLVSGLVVLSFSSDHLPQLPVWMIGVVFGRDLFLLLGFFVITHWCGKMKIQPHFISKCATVLQMIVVALLVLGRKDQFGLGLHENIKQTSAGRLSTPLKSYPNPL